jgi:hypothetical protein
MSDKLPKFSVVRAVCLKGMSDKLPGFSVVRAACLKGMSDKCPVLVLCVLRA